MPFNTEFHASIREEFQLNKNDMIIVIEEMVGILFQKSIWAITVEALLYSIILLISLSCDKKKSSDFFGIAIYFAIFGVSYLWIK